MIDFGPIVRFGLLMLRPGMLVVAGPAFGGTYAPPLVKVGLTVFLALALVPVVALPADGAGPGLMVLAMREVLVGLALAMGLRALVAAAEFAGHLSGFQIGFTYASLVDPQTGARNNVLSALYGSLTLLVVFLLDAHHDFLRALAYSFEALPVGAGGAVSAAVGGLVARTLGLVFVVGVQLAVPVVVVLLVVEVALGLLSRAAPTLNVMVQGFPIRVLVGLFALAATLRVVPAVVRSAVPHAVEIGAQLGLAFR